MILRTFPTIRARLTALSTTELFHPMTKWHHSLEAASALAATFVLSQKTGNFQVRLGIQTATAVIEDANAPLNPASASGLATAAPTRTFIRFDPNGATDGNIDTAAYFRVGALYSLTSGTTPGEGSCEIQGLCWR